MPMNGNRFCRWLFFLCLPLLASCLTPTDGTIPQKDASAQYGDTEFKPSTEVSSPPAPIVAKPRKAEAKVPAYRVKKDTPDEEEEASTAGKPETPSMPAEGSKMGNQELLDSALEFCEASNDFWERGDLDNALDALDKAYSLILKVDKDADPEVLQQKEDLRFTISKRILEVYTSRFTVANGFHKAIPLEMNSNVEQALNVLKGRERKFFLSAYQRSGLYRPAIVEALKKEGLPEELSWLPLIESGFNVRALSRARALGLWQFIASTGYKYGLKRDLWIDERMDPKKSTQAAIAYLKELHQIFGDWTTVLAAYNCGERRVLDRIRKQQINYLDNFWDLYNQLPSETAFYVPKFLAVLHILHDPQAHGFDLPPLDEPIPWEGVTITKQILLKTIAERLDVDYGALKSLNPELRRYVTPKESYVLKVPEGKGPVLLAQLGDMPVYHAPVSTYVVHRVHSGDTLSSLAMRYRTSVQAIMAMNNLRRSGYLKVGWRLKIPTSRGIPAQEEEPGVKASKSEGGVSRYVVRKGDSLWMIANRFGTTTKAIKSLNNMQSNDLQVGQALMIPDQEPAVAAEISAASYQVKRGDSPYIIAKRNNMELAEFLKMNNLTPSSTIFPGQVLMVKSR